jgi:hypothetical protein
VLSLLSCAQSAILKGIVLLPYILAIPGIIKRDKMILITYNPKSIYSKSTEKSKKSCSSQKLQLTQSAFLQKPNLLIYIETKQEFLCILLEALNAEKLTLGNEMLKLSLCWDFLFNIV